MKKNENKLEGLLNLFDNKTRTKLLASLAVGGTLLAGLAELLGKLAEAIKALAAVAVVAILVSGCSISKATTLTYDMAGNVTSKTGKEQKCIATFCGDSPNVQMRDASGVHLKIGLPVGGGGTLPIISLSAGGATELSAPTTADACSRTGVVVDADGQMVSADREVCVGVME